MMGEKRHYRGDLDAEQENETLIHNQMFSLVFRHVHTRSVNKTVHSPFRNFGLDMIATYDTKKSVNYNHISVLL